MAKGNMFLGMARGAVGDVVFSRLDGQQVTRARNRNPRNPKTNAQLMQRAISATILRAYQSGKSIFDHSFEGKSAGAPNQREFMSLNMRALRSAISADIDSGVTDENQNGRVVAPGINSPVGFVGMVLSQGSYQQNLLIFTKPDVEGGEEGSINMPAVSGAETCAEYAARVGLIANDIYTICGFRYDGNNMLFSGVGIPGYGDTQYAAEFFFLRLIVKADFIAATTAASAAKFGDIFTMETEDNYISPATIGAYPINYDLSLTDFMDNDAGYDELMIGIIRSRRDQDLRSNTKLDYFTMSRYYGIYSSAALPVWQQGVQRLGDSSLILEGGNF
jgi:hypothetical protein